MSNDNNKVQIVNEDGKLVGRDAETGEQIPVDWGGFIPEQIGTPEEPAGPVYTEVTDSDGFVETYAAETTDPYIFADNDGNGYEGGEPLIVHSHILNVRNNDIGSWGFLGATPSGDIYESTRSGWEFVANAGSDLEYAAINPQGDYLTIKSGTAYVYLSASDIGTTSNAQRSTDDDGLGTVYSPRDFAGYGYKSASSFSDSGFVWGEYQTAGASQVRIIRYDRGDNQFYAEVTESTDDHRHFHSLDFDPYNAGEIWVTAGDGVDKNEFWRSTDWGQTWTKQNVAGTTGDGRYRTLRVVFTENHIYWPTDSNNTPSGKPEIWRASRSDVANAEKETELPTTEAISYGATRTFSPDGMLIAMMRLSDDGKVPLFFYEFGADKPGEVTTYEVVNSSSGSRGLPAISPYRDQRSEYAYGRFASVPTALTDTAHSRGVRLSKVQVPYSTE